jgi:hypothetical protein
VLTVLELLLQKGSLKALMAAAMLRRSMRVRRLAVAGDRAGRKAEARAGVLGQEMRIVRRQPGEGAARHAQDRQQGECRRRGSEKRGAARHHAEDEQLSTDHDGRRDGAQRGMLALQ